MEFRTKIRRKSQNIHRSRCSTSFPSWCLKHSLLLRFSLLSINVHENMKYFGIRKSAMSWTDLLAESLPVKSALKWKERIYLHNEQSILSDRLDSPWKREVEDMSMEIFSFVLPDTVRSASSARCSRRKVPRVNDSLSLICANGEARAD